LALHNAALIVVAEHWRNVFGTGRGRCEREPEQPAGVVGTFRLALSTMAVALGGFSLVAVAAAGP
jgi:hypothetical protein